jgi:citrate/tricarballylate utilization protein
LPQLEFLEEARRQMTICNACRYCEGYCAVFPAMELRRTFTDGDLAYLSNLCFDCRACLYACQYQPPHAFNVNVPRIFSELRADTYADYAWPGVLRPLLDRNPRSVTALTAASIVAVLVALLMIGRPSRLVQAHTGPGAFYEIAPYAGIVGVASAIVVYALVVFGIGAVRFWRDTGARPLELVDARAFWKALQDTFDLGYLRGGGAGCFYPDENRSQARRIHHQLVFYGFLADALATTLAAIYQDVFDIMPPFDLLSAPVVFGTAGGIAMLIGTVGLLHLKWRSDRAPATSRMLSMDVAFLVLLNLASLTGMFTLIFRSTAAMGLMLAVHLGVVAALFIAMPYGKFAHIVYRYAALVRNRVEQKTNSN